MRSLGEQRAAGSEVVAKVPPGVGDVRSERLSPAEQRGDDLVRRWNVGCAERGEELSGLRESFRDPPGQDLGPGEVRHAHRPPGGERLVGRADSAQSRPDLAGAGGLFPRRVQEPVPRQNERRAIGEKEFPFHADAGLRDRRDLREERLGVDDDPRPDHGRRPADDSGGQQVQREVAVTELDGMSGVVAAVVPGDDLEPVREKVHDLPFSLVAILAAQDRRDFHGGKVSVSADSFIS